MTEGNIAQQYLIPKQFLERKHNANKRSDVFGIYCTGITLS